MLFRVMRSLGEFVVNLLLLLVTPFFTKNKNVWVFGSWFGRRVSDNPMYLYRKIKISDNIRPVWIYKGNKTKVPNEITESYYYLSLKGIYFQLICGCCVVSHSIRSDLLWGAINTDTIKVNTWHGSPIKKILKDSKDRTKIRTIIKYILGKLFPRWDPVYDIVISSSPEVTSRLTTAFSDKALSILEFGYPRVESMIEKSLTLDKTNRLLYLPTLRDSSDFEKDLFTTFGFEPSSISKKLEDVGYELIIKLHPMNKLSDCFLSSISSYSNISVSDEDDVYTLLSNSDILVTDFSSVYLDYIMLNKPVLFTSFNKDLFSLKERQLYYSYEDVTWGPYLESWSQLSTKIDVILKNGIEKKQNEVKNIFNSTNHVGASRDIIEYIRKVN